MRHIHFTILLFVAAIAIWLPTHQSAAQEFEWSVDANVLLQNREGGNELLPDQTIIFSRLNPEIGVSFLEGRHAVMGGMSWYQPMNDRWKDGKVVPTLYYKYNDSKWRFAFGMVPRSILIDRPERFLWSDSMNFHQPNTRGAILQYVSPQGHFEALFDWRQMQSEERREAFNLFAHTRWHVGSKRMAVVGATAQYNHIAKHKNAPEDEGVIDDGTIYPFVGLDLSRHAGPLDSLSITAGAILQLQRSRSEEKWRTPCAFNAQVIARWRWLELEQTVTAGKPLFPLYDTYGSELNMGDAYYNSKLYSRTSLTAHIVQNRFVDLTAGLSFHANKQTTGFWQQLCVRVILDKQLWKHRHNKEWIQDNKISTIY